MKKTILSILVIILFGSCATKKYCPGQDRDYFYKQQGTKMPQAVKLNQKGYSRPKFKN